MIHQSGVYQQQQRTNWALLRESISYRNNLQNEIGHGRKYIDFIVLQLEREDRCAVVDDELLLKEFVQEGKNSSHRAYQDGLNVKYTERHLVNRMLIP
jgi:hypothetical protein